MLKNCASSVNRTRASSMATTNSTTRPMMLIDVKSTTKLLYRQIHGMCIKSLIFFSQPCFTYD